MTVPGSANPLLLATAAGAGGYSIERSLRFNSSDSAYLSRTPASAGNRKTWTWAGWVKRSNPSTSPDNNNALISAGSNVFLARLDANDGSNRLEIYNYNGSSFDFQLVTTQVFRDFSAWFHLVICLDTDNGTSSNRLRIYVNGERIATFSTASYPSSGFSTGGVNNTVEHRIGSTSAGNNYFNGYLADIYFIDGQALDPTSFGEFSATTGVWMPKAYSGSYGSQGWHLDFSDNSTATALGTDVSGLGNTWSVNNISVSNGLTSVAAATGALPVYNTTDTYGAVKGTGTRTDSNSSSIVLALPMDGTNNGTTFTDESATIKGSGSAKSITRNGDTKTSTTQSKFYGSSGYFDGSGDYLTAGTSSDYIFGTGDFTIECWAYFGALNTENALISNHNNDSNWVFKIASGKIQYYPGDGNGSSINGTSTINTGSWYHFSATRQSGTLRLFVNGVLETTATVSANYTVNNTLHIGAQQNNLAGSYLNGYLQDARIYKGVAKYTSNFNPPSSTQNPTLAAGNDSLVDVPTNGSEVDTGVGAEVRGNYCTWNPLDILSGATLSNGNLDLATPTSGYGTSRGTLAVSSGKFYWEILVNSVSPNVSDGDPIIGIWSASKTLSANWTGQTADSYGYQAAGGNKTNNGSLTAYGASFTAGDVIGIALNLDAGTLVFYKNGSSQGTAFSSLSGTFAPSAGDSGNSGSCSLTANFGQRPFAYTAPSGFKALCTANLPAPVITKPSTVMDVKLYTGNGGTQTISGLGFSPDFVWLKARSAAERNVVFDQVRGASYRLLTDGTESEALETNTLSAFTSDGFSVGVSNGVNGSGTSMVAWTWDAGSSTVTNTQGSISSQVRANASAGFSVVTWTGDGVGGRTVGHGLGVAPAFVVIKQRIAGPGTDLYNWNSYHAALGATQFIALNTTGSASTAPLFNDTAPTSTVFSLGSSTSNYQNVNNASGVTYVAYCWAPLVGYSSFGSYTGNGSADGPFVALSFRPRWVMVKRTDSTSQWPIVDAGRSPYNEAVLNLSANISDAEYTGYGNQDFLSNGFKLRTSATNWNASGGTYIYAAFAESPFQYARAR